MEMLSFFLKTILFPILIKCALNCRFLLLIIVAFFVNIACHFNSTTSQKHIYIILTPLTQFLYSKTGVYNGYSLFFLFLLKNIDCGYSLEPPRRISELLSKNFQFLVVKFSIYLNGRVFVMIFLQIRLFFYLRKVK